MAALYPARRSPERRHDDVPGTAWLWHQLSIDHAGGRQVALARLDHGEVPFVQSMPPQRREQALEGARRSCGDDQTGRARVEAMQEPGLARAVTQRAISG